MTHRVLAFLSLLTLSLQAAPNPQSKPNILWLIAEDLGPELTCYGTPQVWTPNIDRLASQGVRYTRAYTTAPVCSASRSAFMTGMYQTTIGAHNHRAHRDDGYELPTGVRVLTDWFRDLQYFTANIREFPGFGGTGKTDWNFNLDHKPFDSNNWSDLKTHQPFYAQINFQETHRPYKAPKKADPAKVVIPPYYPDHPITRADWAAYLDDASELDRKIGVVLKRLEADGLADNTIILFFGDHGQSHVRGKQFCYEEGLHIPLIIRYPRGLAASAASSPPGTVNDQLIEAIDFTPTTLDLANTKIPEKIQGHIFLGAHTAPPRQLAFGARDRCDETVFRFRTVRDDRYRYIKNFTPDRPSLSQNKYKEKQYPVWNLLKELDAQNKLTPEQKFLTAPTMPPEELYDLQTDPYEIHNLATSQNPDHQAALNRLRAAVEKWITDTHDQGATFEPKEVAANEGRTKPK